jgi:hypothetical protein
MKRWVGLGVVADNLINIARAMAEAAAGRDNGADQFCAGK